MGKRPCYCSRDTGCGTARPRTTPRAMSGTATNFYPRVVTWLLFGCTLPRNVTSRGEEVPPTRGRRNGGSSSAVRSRAGLHLEYSGRHEMPWSASSSGRRDGRVMPPFTTRNGTVFEPMVGTTLTSRTRPAQARAVATASTKVMAKVSDRTPRSSSTLATCGSTIFRPGCGKRRYSSVSCHNSREQYLQL